MRSIRITVFVSLIGGAATFGPRTARAQDAPAEMAAQAQAGAPQENPIPPGVEGHAVPYSSGGYCYGGPHPAPGGGWEAV